MSELLSGAERKRLRGVAQALDPILTIGKSGLSEAFLMEVEKALVDKELIKIRFSHFKEERKSMSQKLAEATQSELLATIGHNAVVYRKRKVESEPSE